MEYVCAGGFILNGEGQGWALAIQLSELSGSPDQFYFTEAVPEIYGALVISWLKGPCGSKDRGGGGVL